MNEKYDYLADRDLTPSEAVNQNNYGSLVPGTEPTGYLDIAEALRSPGIFSMAYLRAVRGMTDLCCIT